MDYFESDITEVIASGYLVDDWAPSPKLRTNLGFRVDDYRESFGATFNPRLAVIARPYARGNTKLLLGRAFRAPSAYERFYNDMGVTQVAAGPLAPETIVSGEIEHTHAVDDDLHLVAAVFAEQLSNMVVLQPTTTPDVFKLANLTDPVRGFGGEGELRWEPGGGAFVSFALSWHRTRLVTAGGAQPLPNAPTHVASLRFIYPLVGSALRLGTEMILDVGRTTIDGMATDDALTWNATVSGDLRFAHGWRMRYFAGVYNLLDDRTGYPVGAEVASGTTVARYPRIARMGLGWSF